MPDRTLSLPKDVRDGMRQLCRTDTYYLANAVLGFKDLELDVHLPMTRFMEGPAKRKLALVPRGHLKTHLWTIANSIRRICCDPNTRILIVCDTEPNASKMLGLIERIFQRNRLFQALFPELIWPSFVGGGERPTRWSSEEMEVPRTEEHTEATIEVMGVKGAVVSRHYRFINLDDLATKEAAEAPNVMRKCIDWYQYAENLLVSPDEDEIDTYGTPWTYHDLYKWVEENEPDVVKFFRSCYADEGQTQPLWAARFSLKGLQRMRRKQGTFKFSCQMLCHPYDPEGTQFRDEWLRYFTIEDGQCVKPGGSKTPVDSLRRYLRIDPAMGETADAAQNAICVDGVSVENDKYLLDTWNKRCHPFEMIEQAFSMNARWQCESIGIEAVQFQKFLKPYMEQEAERRGVWLNIVPFKTTTRQSKPYRIRGIQPYFERGEIWVQRHQQEFLQQYRDFPIGKLVDLLDVFAYGPQMWERPEDDAGRFDNENAYWMHQQGRSELTGY